MATKGITAFEHGKIMHELTENGKSDPTWDLWDQAWLYFWRALDEDKINGSNRDYFLRLACYTERLAIEEGIKPR